MKNEKFEKFISPFKTFFKKTEEKYYNFIFNKNFVFKKFIKKPIIKENTFLVWEACSTSHSEVVPGFSKYLFDLGYDVSVLINPKHYKDGLFSRFENENISYNKLTKKQTEIFFKYGDLSNLKGVLVTTAGKLCDNIHYEKAYEYFNSTLDKSRIFLVEHDIKEAIDNNSSLEKIITLRKMNYKNAKTVVVNPNYFGKIKRNKKNGDIVNFLTIGVIKPRKKDNGAIIDAVKKLNDEGIKNFKITVIGKGKIKDIPPEIRKYFNIKGRLPFNKMYDEIEKGDYIITSYDDTHKRYITTGTSGNFQLVYGFLKPCIISKDFSKINGFDDNNAIIYDDKKDYYKALKKAIDLNQAEYENLQNNLNNYVKTLYDESLANLKELIK